MPNISDIFYGTNTANVILRQSWLPSTGLYPVDTTPGVIYVADDTGVVNGVVYFQDDSIMYKPSYSSPPTSPWVSLGSTTVNGAPSAVHVSEIPPAAPNEGDLWWNSNEGGGRMYLWYVGTVNTTPSWIPTTP